jgi:hypothetical protein
MWWWVLGVAVAFAILALILLWRRFQRGSKPGNPDEIYPLW